jgi:hypothetical protein
LKGLKQLHTDFIESYTTLHNEYLLKTEALFAAHLQRWSDAFTKHFHSICAEIVKLQNNSSLQAISRIEYNMLYTNFVNRRYVADVWVYGNELYLDKSQCIIGEYDISFLFVYFNELWDMLLSVRKRYAGKVAAQEVASFMIQALPDFYSYLASIARRSIMDLSDKQPFAAIVKNETFRVDVGDYMASTAPVYVESKNKDSKALSKHFKKRLEKEYTFQDFSGLDFSGCSFTYTEFSYSQFRHSRLINMSLEGSILIGASFYKANMENCCLCNCSIYETDFTHAILRNANFVNARGRAGLPNDKEWRHAGFLPVSFRHADLTNADFTGANLVGADFTDAILDGVEFTYAVLDGAIFSDSIDKSVAENH